MNRAHPPLLWTLLLPLIWAGAASFAVRAGGPFPPENSLALPAVGTHSLRLLAPEILELSLVTRGERGVWDFADGPGGLQLPREDEFAVAAGNGAIAVEAVGFRRRVLYAPLKVRDLRVGNSLYLRLTKPIAEGQSIEVRNPSGRLWSPAVRFTAPASAFRRGEAIHVNQVGYVPGLPKVAFVGTYLGSLGEMKVDASRGFQLIRAADGVEVFAGKLHARLDAGFPFPSYQAVLRADFSEWQTPGEYRLSVPGLGASFPFLVGDDSAGAVARAYALGLYHQRCGLALELPYTRFTHAACHTEFATIPTPGFGATERFLMEAARETTGAENQTAPPLSNLAAALFPFVQRGKIEVAGGHHDAGDYSKYTINSAALIHALVFAADSFAGVGELDNLGLPESGDGKSDLLQEAKWEADFLIKLQDADGGFYFLVYPQDRRYESDVPPEAGDPQVVWPKNTSATAAAVAALAQCSSSPRFRREFPAAAEAYRAAAVKGWGFLSQAMARWGKGGAYQKLTHYGNDFGHDDELAWAACEMFLATGDRSYERMLTAWLDPASAATRKWTWWRLYEGYGNAIRSYAFAVRSGRLRREQIDRNYLLRCEQEIEECGREQTRRAADSAYGTSFPAETKRAGAAGWYFSVDHAFDLAVALQLDYPALRDPRPALREALVSNLNYEAGGNPVNVCYLTGLGWRRPHEIVHQFAQNDARVLPPSGIPIGNVQGGFGWLDAYREVLGALSFPPDVSSAMGYPIYDRWGDSFNLQTEFTIVNQGRGLASAAFLLAQTPLKTQRWKAAPGQIAGLPESVVAGQRATAQLVAGGLDLRTARIVWEAREQEPWIGSSFQFTPERPGAFWVEAEAQLPDGRRVFAQTRFVVSPAAGR